MSEENKENELKIIDANIGGKMRKVKVKEVIIDWEGKKEIVQIRKLKFGERAEIDEQFLKIQVAHGNIPRADVHVGESEILTLLKQIVKAPFPITRDYIVYELDDDIGRMLLSECNSFDKLSEDQKKNSNSQPKTEHPTEN